jgi:hypothetical protein
MSALGQKRTFRSAIVMSAFPPKADIIALPTRDSLSGRRGAIQKSGIVETRRRDHR